jgi:hypothetical protein
MRRVLMFITDVGMLAYWAVTALMALGLLALPPDWLFKDYDDPRVVAWNWSFLPIDLAFSLSGLWALHREQAGAKDWKIWAAVSLTLTFCAGTMAISYWTLTGDFDMAWWLPNLFLTLWPLPIIFSLARTS